MSSRWSRFFRSRSIRGTPRSSSAACPGSFRRWPRTSRGSRGASSTAATTRRPGRTASSRAPCRSRAPTSSARFPATGSWPRTAPRISSPTTSAGARSRPMPPPSVWTGTTTRPIAPSWPTGGTPASSSSAISSLQGDEDAVAQRGVERLRQMPLAPRVLDEDHLAGADAARLAVARGELDAGVEIDDVLAARGGVPVEVVVGRDLAEDDARGREARRQSPAAGRLLELHLHVLEVRLAVLVRVEPVDLHGTPSGAAPRGRRGWAHHSEARATWQAGWCYDHLRQPPPGHWANPDAPRCIDMRL